MFGFLKKKLKGALDKFSKKVEEEAPEEEVEVKKEVEAKPEEVKVKEEVKAEEKAEVKEAPKEEVKEEVKIEEKVEEVKEEEPAEAKKEKKKFIRVCPKCGSIDVETEKDNAAKVRFGAPLNYVCKSCGFKNTVFPEVEEDKIEAYRKEIKEAEEIPEIIEEEPKPEPKAEKLKKEPRPKPAEAPKVEKKPEPKAEIKSKEVEKPAEEAPEEEKKGFFRRITEKITTKRISGSQFDDMFWDLELAMLENNVAVEVIEKIKADLKKDLTERPIPRGKIEEVVVSSLKNSVAGLFDVDQIDFLKKAKEKKPLVICFVGINGSGKTTTIAKVARMFLDNNFSIVLAAADTFRAAAIDQLQLHADKLGIKLIKHDYGSDAAAVAFDAVKHAEAKDRDVVLIDTAGRLHSDHNLVEEMKKIVRVSKPDLIVFVGESITGNDCVEQAQKFDEAVGIDGIILSKADVDEKGGAAISVSYVTKKPILYMGVGQEYSDLEPFDKNKLIQSMGL